MIVQRIRTAARRAVIFLGVIAVIVGALVTVEAAAQWRAQTATFDPVPADAISATDAAANEAARAAELRGQLDAVKGQLSDLEAALVTASSSVDDDAASAAATRARLEQAKVRLRQLQGQLKAAQVRLAALNRAAERQAALNRQAASRPASRGGSVATAEPHEVEVEDDH
jgi:chromosome segregation ATPase